MCCVARQSDLFFNRVLWALYCEHVCTSSQAIHSNGQCEISGSWKICVCICVFVRACEYLWSQMCALAEKSFFCLVCKWSCYLLTQGQMMCRSTCQSAVELPWRSHQVVLLATHGFSAIEVLLWARQMVRSYFLFVYLFIWFNKERKLESEGNAITVRWSQDEAKDADLVANPNHFC